MVIVHGRRRLLKIAEAWTPLATSLLIKSWQPYVRIGALRTFVRSVQSVGAEIRCVLNLSIYTHCKRFGLDDSGNLADQEVSGDGA